MNQKMQPFRNSSRRFSWQLLWYNFSYYTGIWLPPTFTSQFCLCHPLPLLAELYVRFHIRCPIFHCDLFYLFTSEQKGFKASLNKKKVIFTTLQSLHTDVIGYVKWKSVRYPAQDTQPKLSTLQLNTADSSKDVYIHSIYSYLNICTYLNINKKVKWKNKHLNFSV